MPVTTTYPGIYIEELPSTSHTIAAAPTSVTVFVGYPHPFKTPTANFNTPKELFSFTDYENDFGGFFQNDLFQGDQDAGSFGDLARAVYQFFLNGGTDAWVVGLPATFKGTALAPATLSLGPVTFTAREITDATLGMQIAFSNFNTVPTSGGSASVSQPNDTLADVTVSYGPAATAQGPAPGTVTETYRQVSLYAPTVAGRANPNYVLNRINGSSALVTAAPNSVPASGTSGTFGRSAGLPSSLGSGPYIFRSADFTNVFQADTPLDKLAIFNLLVIPGVTDTATLNAAITFCERKRAFLLMDPPVGDSADGTVPPNSPLVQDDFGGSGSPIPKSPNAAFYFPYLKSNDPQTGAGIELPPAATVAGVFARTDTNRGVWKAPAGLETTLANVSDVTSRGRMTDMRQGVLNQLGINCVRAFPGVGPVVWGARTSTAANHAFDQWKYVPVRRMALFLEQTLYANLGWVVFEPNDEPLWAAIRGSIEAFMLGLFRQGAFQGTKAGEAFQVKCDNQTTTPADIDNGIVNIVVAFAPLKPAEFVVIKIAQLAGQAQAS